jgi:DEAD/DEAH box helicase domain-containing protein
MAVTDRQAEPWDALIAAGRDDERLVREAFEGPRAARLADIPAELHPKVRDALARVGIESLYAHQAEALHAAWAGR